jgi:hypothetical protein
MRIDLVARASGNGLAAVCAVGLCVSSAVARSAPAKAKPKTTPSELALGSILLNSVDQSADLYRACQHADFKTLAWGLEGIRSKIGISKSEYETEAEFEARKQKMEGALNFHGRVIVCQPLDDNEDAPFEYDADRQVFKGSFRSHQNVWRDTKQLGKYVSRTRMGIRATVTSSLDIEYDVDMGESVRKSSDCLKSDFLRATYEVPVAREEAPSLKARGFLTFLGRIVYPFFESSETSGSPTLDDPHDVYEKDMTIHFRPDEVSVVGPDGVKWKCTLG